MKRNDLIVSLTTLGLLAASASACSSSKESVPAPFGGAPTAAQPAAIPGSSGNSGAPSVLVPGDKPSGAAGIAAGLRPGDVIRSDFAPGELARLCDEAISRAQARVDAIAKSPAAARGFDGTVLAFENATADLADEAQPLSFMKYVSRDEGIHAEGAECEEKVGEFSVRTFGRRDVYLALKGARARNADEARLHQKMLEAFEANGLKLDDDGKLAEATRLFAKLNELQTAFSNNLNNDVTSVEFTVEELAGVSSGFLSRLGKSEDGKRLVVTTKVADYNQVMQNARSAETRRKMLLAYDNRQGEANTQLLEEAIGVRSRIARLLGFDTWADFQLSHNRMAKDSKSVLGFLNGLKDKLAERNRKDIEQLLAFKKSEDPRASKVEAWDILYLANQLKKRDYSLDDDLIREYFPSDHVVAGMFQVYSRLLGVRFEQDAEAHTWSPDVKLYRILDQKDDRLIGYFYTDFIPRPGKYGHFAAFNLINGRALPGGYNQPVAAIVGNFTPPAGGKPSLLSHDEVVTLFHEFGHIMHQTLTRAPYASLSGSNAAQDYVEAPSQMLENWVWQPEILNLVSGHYQDTSRKLPEELLKKMIEAREYQQGYYYTRQLVLGLSDLAYHTARGPVDTAETYKKLYQELLGVTPIEGTRFPATFGHLMGGYDAGYYGYLWSLVYATDMFTVFEKDGVLSAEAGDRYRRIILERGNMEDAQDLIERFIGRPSSNEAFLRKLGIGG